MAVALRNLAREEIGALLDKLAGLRIAVFRAWPYIYDGDMEYERRYLETYIAAPGAFVCGAFDGPRLVGAATAAPLSQHKNEFAEPFERRGLEMGDFFYFGESVLLPEYRGQGVGVRFFEAREAEARRQGFSKCIFSAVIRPPDHPARPEGYEPLDAFWRNRGYRRLDGFGTVYRWKDIGDRIETGKPMEYWVREIGQGA